MYQQVFMFRPQAEGQHGHPGKYLEAAVLQVFRHLREEIAAHGQGVVGKIEGLGHIVAVRIGKGLEEDGCQAHVAHPLCQQTKVFFLLPDIGIIDVIQVDLGSKHWGDIGRSAWSTAGGARRPLRSGGGAATDKQDQQGRDQQSRKKRYAVMSAAMSLIRVCGCH